MTLWPLLEWELRRALRRRQPVRKRWLAALLPCALAAVILYGAWAWPSWIWGWGLLDMLMILGLYHVVSVPYLTGDLIAVERRQQTLELLMLTGLKPLELLFGKAVGAVLVVGQQLLLLMPLFVVAFVTGWVSPLRIVGAMVCLSCLFVFILSMSLLAVAWRRDDSPAHLMAFFLAGLVCLPVPLSEAANLWVWTLPHPVSAWWWLCPAYGPAAVMGLLDFKSWAALIGYSATTLAWSVAAFVLADRMLQRRWHQELTKAQPVDWRETITPWLCHSPTRRRRLTKPWLERNPFAWLALQQQWPVLIGWAVPGLGAILTAMAWLAWWFWPTHVPIVALQCVIGFLVMGSLGMVMSCADAFLISRERSEGTLEVLLTTPLHAAEIIEGQLAATVQLLRPVRIAAVSLCLAQFLSGFLVKSWSLATFFEYVLIWSLLFCLSGGAGFRLGLRSIWMSLNAGWAGLALIRNGLTAPLWLIPGMFIFQWSFLLPYLALFPAASLPEWCGLAGFGLILLVVCWQVARSERSLRVRLILELRSIAQEPVPDPQDPRLARWMRQPLLRFSALDTVAISPLSLAKWRARMARLHSRVLPDRSDMGRSGRDSREADTNYRQP